MSASRVARSLPRERHLPGAKAGERLGLDSTPTHCQPGRTVRVAKKRGHRGLTAKDVARSMASASAKAIRERLQEKELEVESKRLSGPGDENQVLSPSAGSGMHSLKTSMPDLVEGSAPLAGRTDWRRSGSSGATTKARRRRSSRSAGPLLHYLSVGDVLLIHDSLVDAYESSDDPIEPGIRGEGELLASAITRPKTSWEGVRKYKQVHEAAAALTHSLVHNHPFVDGNKRAATVSLLAFLNKNKKTLLVSTNDELFDKITALARHELARQGGSTEWTAQPDAEVSALAKWLKGTTDSKYRPMVARKFFSILDRRGCVIDKSRQGNQVKIERMRQRAGNRLVTYISVRSEGQELTKKTIRKACLELGLGHSDGFDIYSEQGAADFILEWRDILDKLGELDRVGSGMR